MNEKDEAESDTSKPIPAPILAVLGPFLKEGPKEDEATLDGWQHHVIGMVELIEESFGMEVVLGGDKGIKELAQRDIALPNRNGAPAPKSPTTDITGATNY